MQSVESASSSSPASRAAAGLGSKITFAVMITVLLVAIVFAANQNHIIGWLVVAISAGWLILATAVVLFVRRGARAVNNQVKNAQATFAAQQNAQRAGSPASAESQGDPMRDSKLDHSFKIVEVQTRVVTEELGKGADADQQMIERALETIAMTSSNARDMINPDRAEQRNNNGEPPISGDVIN